MRTGRFLHHLLPRIWQSRNWMARSLIPLSWLFAGISRIRQKLFLWGLQKSVRLPVPVVVVGNVVVGGAGKTPVTMAIVRHLLAQGWHPGVISRGHGRQTHDTRAVHNDSAPGDVGDEPLLIRQKTGVPVWVGQQRADAGHALLQTHPETDILICDDGLQHYALARDIDICVMDERGIGNGWLLPAGPLRESWPKSVDLLLHTGANPISGGYRAQRRLEDWAHDALGGRVALHSLIGQPVDAVAGLARPSGFFSMLREKGLNLNQTTALPDHFDYKSWPQSSLTRPLLCTEKDAAKLWQHQPEALAVPLALSPEPAFWQALDQLLLAHKSR
jgi:tetraacyldisaccharide 4'-kinase